MIREKCEFTTNRKDKLKTHIESKHYQNKIKCQECSVEFSRKDNLVRHMKEYHPQTPLALVDVENHSYSNCGAHSYCGGPYSRAGLGYRGF